MGFLSTLIHAWPQHGTNQQTPEIRCLKISAKDHGRNPGMFIPQRSSVPAASHAANYRGFLALQGYPSYFTDSGADSPFVSSYKPSPRQQEPPSLKESNFPNNYTSSLTIPLEFSWNRRHAAIRFAEWPKNLPVDKTSWLSRR